MKRREKRRKIDNLDTETTFAEMNVEGFSWYDPNLYKKKANKVALTKKERRALTRGAFRAMLPMIICMLAGMLLMFMLAFLWLK